MGHSLLNADNDDDPALKNASPAAFVLPTPSSVHNSTVALATVRVTTSLVGLIAILVLVGWLFDVRVLKSVLPTLTTMKANTAICMGLSALAVWQSRTTSSRRNSGFSITVLSLVVFAITAIVASEYLSHWNSGIDQLLFPDLEHQSTDFPPGRLAPGTAAAFLLLSIALLHLDSRPRVSHVLTLATILIAMVGFIGYVYDLPTMYGAGRITSMALHTVVGCLILGVGLLACRPERGLTFLIIKSHSKLGVYTDFLVLTAVLGPLSLGYLVLKAQRIGGFGNEFTLALFTALLMVLSVSIVWITERERHRVQERRLQTADALAKSEERLRLALNSASIGIWVVDPLKGGRHWDARCRSIFGFSPEAVIDSDSILSCVHPEDREFVRHSMDHHVSSLQDGRFQTEYRIFAKDDGSLKHVYGQGQAIFEGEGGMRHAVRSVGTLQDVTALKQGEQHLRRLNHELEQFAYAAAHDLQEPLRNICLATQLLARDYQGKFDASGETLLQMLTEGPLRMQELVRDLLLFSSSLSVDDESVVLADSNVALASALTNLQTHIEEKRAGISCGILPFVRMREMHLVQVLQNLISNALKYSGSRPVKIHVSSVTQGGLCTFRVEDNGIGIAVEHQDRVFLVFKRLHGKSLPGTGIGLALCRRIVEFYGGKIWIESDGQQGSTFLFTVPLGNRSQAV